MSTFRIIHLEDEPETTSWIPGVLHNRYLLEHPEWFGDEAFLDEGTDDHGVRFDLRTPRGSICVEYHACLTPEELEATILESDRSTIAVIILDVLAVDPNGSVSNVVEAAFAIATQVVAPTRILIVSGFTSQIPKHMVESIPPCNILGKPLDADRFVELLVGILRVG